MNIQVRQKQLISLPAYTAFEETLFHGRGEKSVQGFGGKARRKETTGKTKA
jgi:hypothetical protein